ncbi:MAG: folate family ECF transporter S component [Christensenellales bacterium]
MNDKVFKIVASGVLIALSIALTRLMSANLIIAGVPAVRLGVGFVPIMIAGVVLGPYYGMGVGATADLLGFLLFPMGVYFPPITLTSALVGLLPHLVFRMLPHVRDWVRVALAVTLTQIVCSMVLQTAWLSMLYGVPYAEMFYARAVAAAVTTPVYCVIVQAVFAGLKKAGLVRT